MLNFVVFFHSLICMNASNVNVNTCSDCMTSSRFNGNSPVFRKPAWMVPGVNALGYAYLQQMLLRLQGDFSFFFITGCALMYNIHSTASRPLTCHLTLTVCHVMLPEELGELALPHHQVTPYHSRVCTKVIKLLFQGAEPTDIEGLN